MATFHGYPQPSGARMESVIEKTGPALYVAVVTGSPPAGGQAVTAKEFGLKYFDHVEAAISDDGQYLALWTPAAAGAIPVTAGILMWLTATNCIECAPGTVLSGRTVRLRAIGLA